MEKIFSNVKELGDLYLEHEFYNYDEPILFTCVDQKETRYLCSCCHLGSQWVLGKTTPDILMAMIEDKITLHKAFQESNPCYFLQRVDTGYSITRDIPCDAFPIEGEYLDLEDERTGTFYASLYNAEGCSKYPRVKSYGFLSDLRKTMISESMISESMIAESMMAESMMAESMISESMMAELKFDDREFKIHISEAKVIQEYFSNLYSAQSFQCTSKDILSIDVTDAMECEWKSSANLVAA